MTIDGPVDRAPRGCEADSKYGGPLTGKRRLR
ncbi:hypothetical protein BLA6993_03127 [Burkholderia lata]|nr:hypothetical protein BLA6993_03127 [Burkholderia lata]